MKSSSVGAWLGGTGATANSDFDFFKADFKGFAAGSSGGWHSAGGRSGNFTIPGFSSEDSVGGSVFVAGVPYVAWDLVTGSGTVSWDLSWKSAASYCEPRTQGSLSIRRHLDLHPIHGYLYKPVEPTQFRIPWQSHSNIRSRGRVEASRELVSSWPGKQWIVKYNFISGDATHTLVDTPISIIHHRYREFSSEFVHEHFAQHMQFWG